MILKFIETNKVPESYSVDLRLIEIKHSDEKHIILYGDLCLKGVEHKKGYIEYQRQSGKFYRINYSAQGNVKRINPLEVDDDNIAEINNFIENAKA